MEQEEQQKLSSDWIAVLLAVDESDHSTYAFDYYVKELHKTNYKLHVVHCSEAWADMYSEVMEGGPDLSLFKSHHDKERAKVQSLEEKYTALLQKYEAFVALSMFSGKHQGLVYLAAESTEAMRIKCLAQGHNMLMPGFDQSTSVTRNQHFKDLLTFYIGNLW